MDHTAGFLRRPPYPTAVVLICGLVRRELEDRRSDRAAPPPGWRDGQAELCLPPREPGVVCAYLGLAFPSASVVTGAVMEL